MPELGWRYLLAFSTLPLLVFVVLSPWHVPESPLYLAASGRKEEAEQQIARVCLIVCLLMTAPYQAPHLVHKMLVWKDIAVLSFPGVLYGWILQSNLTLPCDLEWLLAGI